ncbi:MAG: hypothetical protein EAZ24_16470, partial [Burkholderiales bacterium]
GAVGVAGGGAIGGATGGFIGPAGCTENAGLFGAVIVWLTLGDTGCLRLCALALDCALLTFNASLALAAEERLARSASAAMFGKAINKGLSFTTILHSEAFHVANSDAENRDMCAQTKCAVKTSHDTARRMLLNQF